jgi:glutamyl-tRNA reductase
MKVGVIGINQKLADLRLRESFAKVCQKQFNVNSCIHLEKPIVLLSTCNRAEIYFSSDELADTHSCLLNILRNDLIGVCENFDQKLYSYFNNDCFQHLAQVTAGLDSAIIAETEIQGQVKVAYEVYSEKNTLPQDMHFLFQKSLKIAKDVRTSLSLGRGMPDLEHGVLSAGCNFFKDPSRARILFVGASDINEKILSFFCGKNINDITLCNRSNFQTHCFAEKYPIKILDWNQLYNWHNYDWIIFGTKSLEFLVTEKDLPSNMTSKKLIIDLCVPRNVDPSIESDARVRLLNIDQIDEMLNIRKHQMSHTVIKARELVIQATKRNIDLFHERTQKRLQFSRCA